MIAFLIRRALQAIIVVLIVTIITFGMLRLIPGNPAVAVIGPGAYRDPASIRMFDRIYGFNLPWYQQYFLWLGHLLHGDLGYSWHYNQSVAALLASNLPKTVILVGISTVLALIIAVPAGIIQAMHRNKTADHLLNAFSTAFYATPAFLIAATAIILFAIKFPIFPPEGPQGEGAGAILSNFDALVLPICSLALVTIALFSRYMRSAVLDNLTEDYVRTARAKGASELRVLLRHVLRNSLIPIATLLGLTLPAIFAGALITEVVFNYPGMGFLFWQASRYRDYPVLLGFTMVIAIATVLGSLLADIAYAILDPRVRYVNS